MDTYGIVSIIALAGAALLAYRAFMGSNAAQAPAKARAVTATPAGRAPGFDPEPRFARLARQRLAERRLSQASVEIGTAEAIPLGDATVDAAVAQTVLVHVPRAAAALAEMCRVVRPGGRVASIDQDGDALVIDHPDKELTRRLVAFSSEI